MQPGIRHVCLFAAVAVWVSGLTVAAQSPTQVSPPPTTPVAAPTPAPPKAQTTYRLDIGGDANITGTYRVNGVPISATSNWSQADNDIFYTTGNVGIGTIPGALLDVGGRMRVRGGSGDSNTAGIWLYPSVATGDRAFVGMASEHSVGFWGNTGAAWGLVMDTTSGSVGIGTTTPVAQLDVLSGLTWGVNGTSLGAGGTGVHGEANNRFDAVGVRGDSTSGTGVHGSGPAGVVGVTTTGVGVAGYATTGDAGYFSGKVEVTGNLTAANIPLSSDARLKEDVRSLSYGLLDLMRLRPVSWRWIDRTRKQLPMGLIAQEVEPVMPELVMRDADPAKPLGLNYMGLLPVMIKAMQDQQDIITNQDARIRALEQALQQLLGNHQGQRESNQRPQ